MMPRSAFVLAAAATGTTIFLWMLTRENEPRRQGSAGAPFTGVDRGGRQVRDAIASPVLERAGSDAPLALGLDRTPGKLAWEEKIGSVTDATDLSKSAKAKRLFSMIPTLPEVAFTTAAEEAVSRLPDAEYNAVALALVANPTTHGAVESVLFADLMERPDAIALPALLRIAQIPDHPYAKYALDNLDLLVGEDFGSDWRKWDAAIRKTLAGEAK